MSGESQRPANLMNPRAGSGDDAAAVKEAPAEGANTTVTEPHDTTRDRSATACKKCGHDPYDDLTRVEAALHAIRARRSRYLSARARYVNEFTAAWNGHTYRAGRREEPKPYPLPPNYVSSIRRLHTMGLPIRELLHAIEITMDSEPRYPARYFRYCMGVAWNKVAAMHDEIHRKLEGST